MLIHYPADIYFQYWNSDSNSVAYNDGVDGLQKLDYVLAAARTRGLKLVLCLVNNWKEFGGIDQYPYFNFKYFPFSYKL